MATGEKGWDDGSRVVAVVAKGKQVTVGQADGEFCRHSP